MANTVEMNLLLNENSREVLEKIAKHMRMTTDELVREIKRVTQAAKEMQQALERTNFFKKVEEEAKKRMPKISDEFKKMQEKAIKSFEHIKKYARNTFLAIFTFSGIALKRFADFEHSVKKIQNITKDSYKTVSLNIRKLAYETGISSKDISKSLYDVIQVVQDIPEKYRLLETSVKLSKAGSADSVQSVNLLTSVMRSYNLTIEETELLASKLIMAQTKGNTTVGKMASNLGKVLPIAKEVGVSLEEILTSVSVMTAGGIKTDQATTSLRAMLSELSRGRSRVSQIFSQINGGMDFKTFIDNGGKVIEVLDMLNKHAKKNGKSLTDYFSNVRSTMGAAALVGMKDKYIEYLSEITNVPIDLLQKHFDRVNEDTKTNLDRVIETFRQFAIEFGQRIGDDLANWLNIPKNIEFKDMFNQERIDKIYATGKAILFFAGSITALGIALKGGKILMELKTLMFWFSSNLFTKVVVSQATTAFSAVTGVATKSITAIQLGISGLSTVIIGELYLLIKGVKATKQMIGSMPKLDGLNIQEKIKKITSEIEKEQQRIKNLREANKEWETQFNITGIEEAEKKLKKLRKLAEETKLKAPHEAFKNHNIWVNGAMERGIVPISDELKSKFNEKYKLIKLQQDAEAEKNKVNGNSKDAFAEFISSIGAKIKNELGIEEKIAMLENAKNKFKSHMNEINIAIENFKADLLKQKIESILKGISLDSHVFSTGEKLQKLEEARKKAEIGLAELSKNPKLNKKTIEELQEKVNKIDFTIFNTKFKDFTDNIKTQIETLKENLKKGIIEPEEVKKQIKILKDRVLSMGVVVDNANKSGITTKGDKELEIKELDTLINAFEKLGIELDETKATFESSVNSLANVFTQIGSITGSQTMTGIGSMLGSVAGMGKAIKDVGSFKDNFKSIGSMFSKDGSFLDGLSSLGSIAGVVTGGLSIISSIGSLTGGAKGKRQKARIERENQRQLKLYEENSKNLLKLTEVIQNNSKKLETFADRLSDNISKNPTLHRITTGKGSLEELKNVLLENKIFGDISAVQKDHTYYKKSWGRVGRKDTYTNRILKDKRLLEYLGFAGNSKSINEEDLKRLAERVESVTTRDVSNVYNTNDGITKSNVKVWAKNIQEWEDVIQKLSDENSSLFKGTTLGSFAGIDYKSNLQLIKEYKDMLKGMGINADKEAYQGAIQSMIEGNNVLITSMQDVRNSFIDNFSTGKESSFLTGMKSYFNNIFKNVSSVIYDVGFSDVDEYLNKSYEKISDKLVDIKTSGKLDFKDIFKNFDFNKLNSADLFEKKFKKQINILKDQLFNSGVDLSVINKILPVSDFNARINELQQALHNAMTAGLEEHKFESFTRTLGQSLYNNVKNSLIKAFSESSLYQGMIKKFIDFSDIKKKIEEAGSFNKVYKIIETKLKEFGYRMEANGLGGFDAINNKIKAETGIGNAYYTDKNQNISFTFNNNYYGDVYGYDDFEEVTSKIVIDNIEKYHKRPKSNG